MQAANVMTGNTLDFANMVIATPGAPGDGTDKRWRALDLFPPAASGPGSRITGVWNVTCVK
jgi:hypothetical protein